MSGTFYQIKRYSNPRTMFMLNLEEAHPKPFKIHHWLIYGGLKSLCSKT